MVYVPVEPACLGGQDRHVVKVSDNGICPSGTCLPGWTGPSCSQEKNLAIRKTVTANSFFSPWKSDAGIVDGKIDIYSGNINQKASKCECCTGTDAIYNNWIKVDLGRLTLIGRLVLYARNDHLPQHIQNLKIQVSNNSNDNYYLLHTVPDKPIVVRFNLTSPRIARYVRLDQSEGINLVVCELQVFPAECDDGTFGELCENRCHCSGQPCNIINGHCPSGKCLPGYHLDTCSQPCPEYYYGNCTARCGQCRNAASCDKVTGECPDGGWCEPGYTRGTCQEVCRHGRYGVDCQEQCGRCRLNATCHHINGTCQNGCAPGYRGTYCTQECIGGTFGDGCHGICRCLDNRICNTETGQCPGGQCAARYRGISCDEECQDVTFGIDCNKTCGQCRDNEPCHHKTGNCRHGCDPGYQGSGCSDACTASYYGPNCQQRCGSCKNNDSCHHVNGNCRNGCEPGYQGDGCTKQCEAGTYGDNCQKTCGSCKNNVPCHHRTGNCTDGCDPEFKGYGCFDQQMGTLDNSTSSQNTLVVVMAVVIAVLGIMVIVISVTFVCYIQRRQRTNTQRSVPTTQATHEGAEQNTYDDLIRTQASPEGAEQNTYDDLLRTQNRPGGAEQNTYEDLLRTQNRPGGAEQDYTELTELTEVGVYTNTSGATQSKQPEIYQNV